MQDKSVNAEQMDFYTADVKNQLVQSEIILQNLLNWSKSELGELVEFDNTTNVQQIADEIIVEAESFTKNKKIEINNLIPSAHSVKIAPDILKIIFRNLTNNAIKFSHQEGRIEFGFNDDNSAPETFFGLLAGSQKNFSKMMKKKEDNQILMSLAERDSTTM